MTPTGADSTQGALYLGSGRMLAASQPRQLTLNAHIAQFLYQPGGLSIAYVSVQTGQDGPSQSVKFVGLKRGETTPLFTKGSHVPEGYFGVSLLGWTADARYLFVSSDDAVPLTDDLESHDVRSRVYCIDVGTTPIQTRPIPSSLPPPSKSLPYADVVPRWSPNHARLLLEEATRDAHYQETARFCMIYDAAQDKSATFSLPPGEHMAGWLDEGHLLVILHTDALHFFSWDIAAGTQTEISRPVKMPAREARDSDDVSPTSPALSLDVEQRFHPDMQGVTGIDSHLLWLRRLGLPKALSALPVGLTPGNNDPQVVWSPTGKQIAFLDHGDLFVTDLTEREATPNERYLAGEKLSCLEERQVAVEALKQIGLAILQYTQDNDEQYPALAGMTENIRPYLPPNALLSVGGHPFLYHAPSNLSLASLDDPAHTVLGTIELPCAVVTLYADGHVQSSSKQGAAP